MANQYAGLRRALAKEKGAVPRCAERLLAIRERLAPLRKRRSDASLLLATWNVRDYHGNRAENGVYLVFTASDDGTATLVTKLAVVK